MSLIKATSRLQIPYSSQTPDEDIHSFMTIEVMVERTTKHQHHLYYFCTVGVIFSEGQSFYLQQLDNPSATMRVSLKFLRFPLPFIGLRFTAHLYGFAHWKQGIGPVLFPLCVTTIPPHIATRLRLAMERVIEQYVTVNPRSLRWIINMHKNE